MVYKYNFLICAGTFDKLHAGHEAFIRYAFSLSRHVYITLTSDAYIKVHKPLAGLFRERKKVLMNFLQKEHVADRVDIIPIDDMYGIAIDENYPLDAILVTDATKKGAELVNHKRFELNLPALEIVVAPFVYGEHRAPISSTAVRSGLIDVSGSLFVDPMWANDVHYLPKELRQELQKPFGKLLEKNDIPKGIDDEKIITVGDITTKFFHNNGRKQKISVVDFIVERHEAHQTLADLGFTQEDMVFTVENPPATLTPNLWQIIRKSFITTQEKNIVIIVKGEEDLAVIPIILIAPLGFHIFYGQPGNGLVWVEVTIATKQKAYALLKQFL